MPNAAVYARMHREYLKTAHPKMYREFQKTGELTADVKTAGQRAVEMYEQMDIQMMMQINKRGLGYLEKIEELEQIPHVVEEIVLHEVVYSL